MPHAPDLVSVIEASYAPSASDERWMRGLVESAAPHLERGLGALAYRFRTDAAGAVEMLSTVFDSRAAQIESSVLAAYANTDRSAVERVMRRPVTTLRLAMAENRNAAQGYEFVQNAGISDILAVIARNSDGSGIGVYCPSPSPVELDAALVARWSRISTHFAAGLRLRGIVAKARADDPSTAIVSPNGRVEHAVGPAASNANRAALRDAVVTLDRARGAMRSEDPDRAVETWRALVQGRYSLVEEFETDGRRYYVARENAPTAPEHDALSLAERQVIALRAAGHSIKLIAYELGLTESTVSRRLGSAMRKKRVRTAVELALGSRGGTRTR